MSTPRFVDPAEATAALSDFVENAVPVLRTGPVKTPAGTLPLVLCDRHAALGRLIDQHQRAGESDARFEIAYCLSVDSPAWIAVKGFWPGQALTWVFALPEHVAVLEYAVTAGFLAVGMDRRPGVLLFTQAIAPLADVLFAYQLARRLRQHMDAAGRN